MYCAAVGTLAKSIVAVELLEQGRKVMHDAFQLHFRTMQKLMAVLAIPFESV
jgi:hypothetical protein